MSHVMLSCCLAIAGEAALEGKWLPAARVPTLESPEELESKTWKELSKGIKAGLVGPGVFLGFS